MLLGWLLKNLYANHSQSHVLILKEWLQLQVWGAKPIAKFLHGIKAIVDELSMIDQRVSNEDLILYVLNGLGFEFTEFVSSI